MKNFILSCESTCDLPYNYLQEKNVSVIFYNYVIDGEEFEDNAGRSKEARAEFFEKLKNGKIPKTSQINEARYEEYFDSLLKDGDVLHIAFGTGMTPSYLRATEAVENLKQKYPERKIIVIDSLCSCIGYGLLVEHAIEMRDGGKTIEETDAWITANRNRVHHQFFSTDLTVFKRSGRVGGLSATIAGILDINPLMRLNAEGKMVAYSKVRGTKKTIVKTAEEVLMHAEDGENYSGKLYVAHSECLDLANQLVSELEKRMPLQQGKIKIFDIGSIICSHCGKGTVAAFFLGDERV